MPNVISDFVGDGHPLPLVIAPDAKLSNVQPYDRKSFVPRCNWNNKFLWGHQYTIKLIGNKIKVLNNRG